MSTTQVVFPLSEILSEFLKTRNQQAIDLVQDAVRKVAKEVNVPPDIKVAPNELLTALVVVQPNEPPMPPPVPTADKQAEAIDDALAKIEDEIEGQPV